MCPAGTFCKANRCTTIEAERAEEATRQEFKALHKFHEDHDREVEAAAKRLAGYKRDIQQGKVSCSTITDKDHPSSGDCTKASRSLSSARNANVRKNYPLVAQDEYRRGADALKAAGDLTAAAAALQEFEAYRKELASPPTVVAKPNPEQEKNRKECNTRLGMARSSAFVWRTNPRPRQWTGYASQHGYENWSVADTNYAYAADACKVAGDHVQASEAIAEREALKAEYTDYATRENPPPPQKGDCKAIKDLQDYLTKIGAESNPKLDAEAARLGC